MQWYQDEYERGLYWIMSTDKDLITRLCSGTLVLTNRFTSNRQLADLKGPMKYSTLREQRISSRAGTNRRC